MAYFDQIILAIDADSCLKLLHGEASFMEKRVLGNVKYLYDVTVTHNDLQYMVQHRLTPGSMKSETKGAKDASLPVL